VEVETSIVEQAMVAVMHQQLQVVQELQTPVVAVAVAVQEMQLVAQAVPASRLLPLASLQQSLMTPTLQHLAHLE
jgi:hypothetical protein